MNKENTKSLFDKPLLSSKVKSVNVKLPELLFGYLVGPFGALLASGIFTSYLNTYFTNVLFGGVESTALSMFSMLLPLLSTILIIAGNLVVGQLIEKTKTKAGKARPWILISSVTLSIACVLMFIVPSSNIVVKMVWYAVAYNLYYSVAYPMYNTANSTLIPVSTRNGSQRGLLASVTNIAGLGVMGAGSMIFPAIAAIMLKTQGAWTIMFIGVAIFTFLACVLQFYFTRERVTEEAIKLDIKQEKIPMSKQLKAATTDKYWWIIIVFYLIFQFSGAMKNLSMQYFCQWIIDNSFWGLADGGFGMTQTLLAVLGAVPMAIAVVLVWPLSNKFGKKNVTLVGMIIGVIGGVIAIIGGNNIVPVAIGVALKCLGSAPACYMILAMIADVLDHIEAKHGFRCDGFTMSIYSSIMAAATGFCTAIFNAMIGVGTTYNSSAATQPDGVLTAISVSYVWVETIAYAVCGVIMLFFIVEGFLKNDKKKIIERQKAEVLAQGGVWIEPEERMRMEQEEQDRIAEEARIAESKAYCEKKGLDFEKVEQQYQAKLAQKKAAAEAKAAAKAKNKPQPPDEDSPPKADDTAVKEDDEAKERQEKEE